MTPIGAASAAAVMAATSSHFGGKCALNLNLHNFFNYSRCQSTDKSSRVLVMPLTGGKLKDRSSRRYAASVARDLAGKFRAGKFLAGNLAGNCYDVSDKSMERGRGIILRKRRRNKLTIKGQHFLPSTTSSSSSSSSLSCGCLSFTSCSASPASILPFSPSFPSSSSSPSSSASSSRSHQAMVAHQLQCCLRRRRVNFGGKSDLRRLHHLPRQRQIAVDVDDEERASSSSPVTEFPVTGCAVDGSANANGATVNVVSGNVSGNGVNGALSFGVATRRSRRRRSGVMTRNAVGVGAAGSGSAFGSFLGLGAGLRKMSEEEVEEGEGEGEEEEAGDDDNREGGNKTQAEGRSYFNFTGFPFPLGPFFERTTLRYEVEAGRIWIFEQAQTLGFSSVTVNVRMTVIKLRSGGLWVHAPIAPTRECIRLLNELDAPVEFIVLPTFAYEHKIYAGPFSRRYPKAKVYVAPRQWSWPLNLPPSFFGIFPAGRLKSGDRSTPWADEIEQKILELPGLGIGPYVEVAFYHKASRSLLVTDTVIKVPEQPPEVVGTDKLLGSAANGIAVKLLSKGVEVADTPVVVNNQENRIKGWQRMVLLILYLGPANLLDPEPSFNKVVGRLIVSPIVKTLVFSKASQEVKEWIDEITTAWPFRQIIPAHFSAPIAATPKELRAVFSFLYNSAGAEEERGRGRRSQQQTLWPFSSLPRWAAAAPFSSFGKRQQKSIDFPKEDMQTLSSLDEFLVLVGAVRKGTDNI